MSGEPSRRESSAGPRRTGEAGGTAPSTGSTRRSRTLSFRILLLTVAVVLLTELLLFLPNLAWERREWLKARATWSYIAAVSAAQAPGGSVGPAARDELLRIAGSLAVILHEPHGAVLVLKADPGVVPTQKVDLRTESVLGGMHRALSTLIGPGDGTIRLLAVSPVHKDTLVELLAPEFRLRRALLEFARTFLGLALPIAALTGAFVYLAVSLLLVRPIRRITDSIIAFRADPERTPPLDPEGITVFPRGEISVAAQELAAMQRDLRTALWRNARLAALGAAIAKVSHDLRNSLSPALLSAERLEMHSDPVVRRHGANLLRAIDHATEMVGRMLDFAREVPPQLAITTVDLHGLAEEAGQSPQLTVAYTIVNRIPPGTDGYADRTLLMRVILNLLRNAIEAGATRAEIRMAAPAPDGSAVIEIADNGPGLPAEVRAKLFRPFVTSGKPGGTGLGLAIAADLMRAQGGRVALGTTGGGGTVFQLTLPARRPQSERVSDDPSEPAPRVAQPAPP